MVFQLYSPFGELYCFTVIFGVAKLNSLRELKGENNITFAKSSKEIALVGTLAHELKHAEQSTKESYEMIYKKDNLGIQQICFLEEAQAYVFGNYVQMLFFQKDGPIDNLDERMLQKADLGTEKLLPRLKEWMNEEPKIGFWDKVLGRTPQKNYKDLEQELIPTMLDVLYRSPYKVDYDEIHPVRKKDRGLSHIPEGFSFDKSFKKGILKRKLREVPRHHFHVHLLVLTRFVVFETKPPL